VSLTDSVEQETKSRESLLVVTIAFMAIGALTTAIAAWKVHRYDSWVNAVQHRAGQLHLSGSPPARG
jgi:hypothetical protein